jgi:HK97 family phage major capsid protein
MVVQVGKFSIGAAVAISASEGSAVNEATSVSSIVTTPIRTISGQITLSRELFDRGLASDAEVSASLGASWAGVLESQVISGSGASGQLTGILNSSPSTSQTYTDASPSAAKNFSTIQNLIAGTSTAFGAPVDAVVLHSRRAAFIRAGQVVNQALGAAGYGAEVIESEGIPVN